MPPEDFMINAQMNIQQAMAQLAVLQQAMGATQGTANAMHAASAAGAAQMAAGWAGVKGDCGPRSVALSSKGGRM